MKIALITDAWAPQINGVVRTWQTVIHESNSLGHEVEVIHPGLFRTIPCPTYPEIRLAVNLWPRLSQLLGCAGPQAIHIATEGPLGLAARQYCLRHRYPFSTSFHTKFAEYMAKRFRISPKWGYRYLRWFHRPSRAVLIATPSLKAELEQKGFQNTFLWTRGVDLALFHPQKHAHLGYQSPIMLYVGRVAVEKNLEAFLKLPIAGTKLVVGDGPQRAELEARYRDAVFVGPQQGEALARYYASADVFVFPSLTDTFGLVMLEALASGTPVAAYPVTGPIDVIKTFKVGRLHDNLAVATQEALDLNRSDCRTYAEGFSWQKCAKLWLDALSPIQL